MKNRLIRPLFLVMLICLTGLAQAQLPDFVDLVEKSSPSVVNISTTRVVKGGLAGQRYNGPNADQFNDMLQQFFGQQMPQMPDYNAESLGSGFFVSDNGYVLTNYHVIRDADTIVVGVNGGNEYEAEIIGVDPSSDLALLKIDIDIKTPFLAFADSSDLKVGEWVMAIGSPFGFDYSVTQGIVSAIGRGLDQDRYVPFIQTDVAINPGSSGGPLLNHEGKVVGINSQIVSRTGGYIGLSFAIPSNVAKDVLKQLKNSGKVKRGYLGVAFQNIDKKLAKSFGLDQPKGALVAQIMPGSPADDAGLKDGDIIVQFNDKPINDASDLPHLVGFTVPGTQATLAIIRDGNPQKLNITVGELESAEDDVHVPASKATKQKADILGFELHELPTKEQNKDEPLKGLVIAFIEPNSPASAAGLRPGDIVLTVNRTPVNSLAEYKDVLKKIKSGMTVPVLMLRRGLGQRYVALKVE